MFPIAEKALRALLGLVKFFNPRGDIEKTEHKLPHWQQDDVPVFVTFRLADSLPQEVLQTFLAERERFLLNNPLPWDEITEACYHGLFSDKLDEALDAGHGGCVLRDPRIAQIVKERLHYFDGDRYKLQSYTIMPNHVHVLFSLAEEHALPAILQGWKGAAVKNAASMAISAVTIRFISECVSCCP